MRTLMIAAVVATMAFGGTAADAQRIGPQGRPGMPMPMPPQGQPMPMPKPMPNRGSWQGAPRPNPQPMPAPRPGGWNGGGQWQGGGQWNGGTRGQYNGRSRWGGRIGGFWFAGVQAPGGWNGYVRVKRGKRLPNYWVSQNYVINDWQMYGLGAPPSGYYWSRYYNDAVLIDREGQVYDSIGSVDWDRYQGGYAYDEDGPGGDGGRDYPRGPEPQGPGYGADYAAPGYGGQSYNGTTSTRTYTYTTGGGYAGGPPPMGPPPRIAYGESYYVSPGSVVTVTMPGAVTTTTTTTTEYIYERRAVAKRVWRKPVRKWRPKPRCSCAPRPMLGS